MKDAKFVHKLYDNPPNWECLEETKHNGVSLSLLRYPDRVELMHYEVHYDSEDETCSAYFAKDEEAKARACFADEKAKLGK